MRFLTRRHAALAGFLSCIATVPLSAQQTKNLILATTTSVRDAGLLDTLLPPFEQRTGYVVKVIAVGTGQALELGRRGEPDILILHAPDQEMKFVADGFGIDRRALAHNEFVILGPPSDPAHIRGMVTAAEAFRAIAKSQALFVSRGDNSGTNIKENTIWKRSGVHADSAYYRESGQGMGATLQIAEQLRAYTLSDIATYLAYATPLTDTILVEGDTALYNTYHVIRENPAKYPRVNVAGAIALADYLVSPETQAMIAAYKKGKFGRSIFVPDAGHR